MTPAWNQAGTQNCPRCGHATTARGGRPPLYCAVCGQRLLPLQADAQQARSARREGPLPLRVVIFLGISFMLWLVFGRGC